VGTVAGHYLPAIDRLACLLAAVYCLETIDNRGKVLHYLIDVLLQPGNLFFLLTNLPGVKLNISLNDLRNRLPRPLCSGGLGYLLCQLGIKLTDNSAGLINTQPQR